MKFNFNMLILCIVQRYIIPFYWVGEIISILINNIDAFID
ncbi:hypothetical protein FTU_0437 [Francisella tularensis subsp. tularensis TIGB03]|nr:hypothetical protein FTH_0445 [Francisella tularensis subsp. holarctica OSU18]AFB78549.1 hypothetical protein FTU_0437 [Francisella tularensis subsp. tularensis TIGB03]AFB80094.1 hypothetical protein FTV_0353 [Francisella tularensis subsp. tularensis TI0902]AKE21061.1 hypothetical protein RO31_0430 [Francisella tularensis subsp. tularensis str. SCHU S4 substr. NR-28534]AKZ19497.1 hypothetical protein FTZ_0354 [Francisella tularensis subsp. tularensis MA00-2987]